ncbi:MAG: TonB-dependent receptor [Enterobacterales bacterium]|nr:TonB-dependent receptor [Enterobacterales bacterium]
MDSPGSYTEPFGWDELQVYKGVETLMLGAGGPAGTLNFKRYKPDFSGDPITGKLMASYSNSFYKLGSDVATGNDDGYLRLISQYYQQESYRDGNNQLTRTAFKTTSNTLIGGYNPSQDSEIRLSIMANRGRDALFAGTMMDGPKTDMDALQLHYFAGDPQSINFSEYQIYWNQAHHIMDNYSLRTQTAPMRMLTDSNSNTKGLKWHKSWQTNKQIWQTAIDWQNVQRNANRFMGMMGIPEQLQSKVWPNNELDIKGAALEMEYQFSVDHRLKTGVRFDQVNASASITQNLAIYQNYYLSTPNNSQENNLSGFARYYYKNAKFLYWAGVSSNVRTADATERYLAAKSGQAMMRWIGNPDIQPERHNQIELGTKWNFNEGWSELNIYYNSIANFILRDRARMQSGIIAMDMATIYRNVDATLYGFEWSLKQNFDNNWRLNTNIAYVKGTNDNTRIPLYQIPPVEGLIELNHHKDRVNLWLDVKWALTQTNVDSDPMYGSGLDNEQSSAWLSVNFKASYELNHLWQLTLGINNVFDREYAYHVSRANMDPFNPEPILVNEPGRQFWLSIIARL